MKVFVIQSKNGIMMNVAVSVKNYIIWVLVKMISPSMCNCECNKTYKIDEYLDIKNCFCEKRVIGKLVLECEDEILTTTKNLLNDN